MENLTTTFDKSTRRKILVIDDNRDAADTLAMMLRLKGYEIEARYDGREAVTVGQSFLPEVAILDIGMPGLDGYETCRLIRQQPWGKNMTVIALTGYGQQEDIRKSMDAGFDSHMLKPVHLPELLERIGRQV